MISLIVSLSWVFDLVQFFAPSGLPCFFSILRWCFDLCLLVFGDAMNWIFPVCGFMAGAGVFLGTFHPFLG
jgi:hypothetical protein